MDCLLTFSVGNSSSVIGSDELQERFGFDETVTGIITTSPYFIAAVSMPIIGMLADKFGQRISWILLADFITITSHLF